MSTTEDDPFEALARQLDGLAQASEWFEWNRWALNEGIGAYNAYSRAVTAFSEAVTSDPVFHHDDEARNRVNTAARSLAAARDTLVARAADTNARAPKCERPEFTVSPQLKALASMIRKAAAEAKPKAATA